MQEINPPPNTPQLTGQQQWDTGTHHNFYEYYAQESLSESALQRFRAVQDLVIRNIPALEHRDQITVADIGCGAGTLSRMWAQSGYRVFGLDVNEALIQLACERAAATHLDVDYRVGSATALPWPDQSMDICLVPELLEHVEDWQSVVNEAVRVLKPGGVLYLSTTNRLCPVQQEFELPLYSWYPAFLKRRYERLAVTTRPELANYAKFPAVHWFTFFQLQKYLAPLGLTCLDRFDLGRQVAHGGLKGVVFASVCVLPGARFLGHVATSYTVVLAKKKTVTTHAG